MLERFFCSSLWYGFTGTPIFEENKYEQKGDLPQTTEQLYGKCLHSYTIKEAIHDEAVLGFMIENLGPKNANADLSVFDTEEHMRRVLDVILNQSYTKFGMQNVKGKTYEGILTVNSIPKAQKYYELLKKIKAGQDELKIHEDISRAMPDFPKFAITYSLSENEETSKVYQDKMQESMDDYNAMFGTSYKIEGINAYNSNLNDRLARKEKRYMERSQQLDLVIVVDRLLTGFDAPCLSTIFIDRQPMKPQEIIQAFSRTNRLFDDTKQYGQVVTFQSPDEFKEAIDCALRMYSLGGDGETLAEDFEDVKKSFSISIRAIHGLARKPEDIALLSKKQKKSFVKLFRDLDHDFAHLKAFSSYDDKMLSDFEFSEDEYEDYAAMYKNVMEELRKPDDDEIDVEDVVLDDYDLIAYNKLRIDFDYIMELLQGVLESINQNKDGFTQSDFQAKISEIREMVDEFSKDNQKVGEMLHMLITDIENDREKYLGQDVSVIFNKMRSDIIDKEIDNFTNKWFLNREDVKFGAYHYKNGKPENESVLKENAQYAEYRDTVENPISPKFKFNKTMIKEFSDDLMDKIFPLLK